MEEGRTGDALVAQRHPVNSAASKRLTVVPRRRSILEIQACTIRSGVHEAAARRSSHSQSAPSGAGFPNRTYSGLYIVMWYIRAYIYIFRRARDP